MTKECTCLQWVRVVAVFFTAVIWYCDLVKEIYCWVCLYCWHNGNRIVALIFPKIRYLSVSLTRLHCIFLLEFVLQLTSKDFFLKFNLICFYNWWGSWDFEDAWPDKKYWLVKWHNYLWLHQIFECILIRLKCFANTSWLWFKGRLC